MRRDTSMIDIEKLRDDMREDCLVAYLVGGFGCALVESVDIDMASDEELVEMALQQGIDLQDYRK